MVALSATTFWTLDRLAEALLARIQDRAPFGNATVGSISTDTRSIRPGDCFVALTGEHFDAHDFLETAVNAGAGALVVSKPVSIGRFSIPVFYVDDTLLALGDLGQYRRSAWGKPVVGIAGSNGKTSTKELVRAALSGVYDVHATTGNLNNRIGVPLTLLALPDDADLAVVEIGTSIPGEVALLREIVHPDIAIITSIGEEHLEGLGDLAGVFREELSVCDGVPVIVTPSVQPEVGDEARRKAARVIEAGLDSGDVRAESWSIDTEGQGTIVFDGVTIRPPVRGIHNVRNAMLALTVARECGVPTDVAGRAIEAMPVPSMRAAWQRIGRAMLINDAYNSNPGSARAAIEMLAAASGTQRVAILGTMRELGPDAARYHDDVARAAIASPAELVAGIGDFESALRRVAPDDPRVVTAPDVDELWARLAERLVPDATILLKASRGVKLERILPHITTWATA
jgi:UDP-N-acetylmuramoyl-tripeptide--D-alanyl-D-alanine ligase